MSWRVELGDCVEVLAAMPEASVDAVVTDPPYGLSREPDAAEVLRHWLAGDDYEHRGGGFMGQTWDSFVPGPAVWREAFRVLKPGGHLLAFFGSRTADLGGMAIRLAGFEIRDTILWLYGSGFPKSLDVSKAIDKAAGAERDVVGPKRNPDGTDRRTHAAGARNGSGWDRPWQADGESLAERTLATAPTTENAQKWEGWGTALKPAHEPVVVARKPLAGTVAANVVEHGTGALNIDGCRVPIDGEENPSIARRQGATSHLDNQRAGAAAEHTAGGRVVSRTSPERFAEARPGEALGRWPANVVLDEEAAALLDEQAPDTGAQAPVRGTEASAKTGGILGEFAARAPSDRTGDRGGASRFFYCAKASTAERNAGLDHLPLRERGDQSAWAARCRTCGCRHVLNGKTTCDHDDDEWTTTKPRQNMHPTVKPIELMRWLVRLVTPPGGTVLDPFAGSGTTGCAAVLEGFEFVGVERDERYVEIARGRIAWWRAQPEGVAVDAALAADARRRKVSDGGQGTLDLFGSAA